MSLQKCIRSYSDLAIGGAPPAFAEPVHVGRPNIPNRGEFLRRTAEALDRVWLTNNGPLVRELEEKIANYLGVKHCVAMCNGTVALEIAIRALGLEGEVIVPSYSFVATAHALHWQGIKPVFADIDPATHNLDPAAVRRMITSRTTGLIGVHLWGRAAPVEELQRIADEHGLALMFDAAHAFGCSHGGRSIGGFGRAEVFSFHATKFFNTFEGGAVTTNDDEVAGKARLMRNFGFSGYDNVVHIGTNGKLAEVCAAMGLANLDALQDLVAANRAVHSDYRDALGDLDFATLLEFDEREQNNFQYCVIEISSRCRVSRDEIVKALHAENILARKYFWPGCHRMKPYRDLFPDAGLVLANTKDVAERVIVLPTGPSLPDGTVATISSTLRVMMDRAERYEIEELHE